MCCLGCVDWLVDFLGGFVIACLSFPCQYYAHERQILPAPHLHHEARAGDAAEAVHNEAGVGLEQAEEEGGHRRHRRRRRCLLLLWGLVVVVVVGGGGFFGRRPEGGQVVNLFFLLVLFCMLA